MLSKISKRLLGQQFLQIPWYAFSQSSVPANNQGGNYRTPDIEQIAYLEYKKYPDHLSHFDPKSKDYVESERDDKTAKVTTESYNKIIDSLKADLKMQQQVNEILRKQDRPYLRGTPGVHKNITGGVKEYTPPHLKPAPAGQSPDTKASEFLAANYANENRFINQSVYYPKYAKMTHFDVEWPKELDSRPVTDHFHPEKGYKYDVEVPYAQRYEYQADRLGHPEILGTPLERLLRLEGEVYHPNWLNQPFVKMPTGSPNPSLNFEEGEVLYENTRLLEWAKFWNYSVIYGYLWCALFVPFQLLFKTHLTLEHACDNLFWPYFQKTFFFWDNNALHIPVVGLTAIYATYIALSYVNNVWSDYVVRAQYSKDKELLFVTRVSPYGSTDEEVYETAHLELLPPSQRSGVQHISAQDEDGLWDVTCMNSQRSLVFYNENKYWNPQLKREFWSKTMNLWTKDYVGFNRVEQYQQNQNQGVTLGDGETKKIE